MKLNKIEYNKSGIYKIINLINNKIYIGSSINLYHRFYNHLHFLKNNKHCNDYLQRAFNKYGIENFKFMIVEECTIENLIQREQYYIDTLKPQYNIRIIADSNLGIPHSEQSKLKQSRSMKGRKLLEEHKIKIGLANKGLIKPRTCKVNKNGWKRTKESVEKQMLKRVKPVLKYDSDNNLIMKYNSVKEAKIANNTQFIGYYCRGLKKDPKGFIWRYENEFINVLEIVDDNKLKEIKLNNILSD